MNQSIYKFCLILVCTTSLVASGGGSGGGDGGYQAFNSTADVTSILGGQTLQTNGTNGQVLISNVTGTLKHKSGALSIKNGGYTLDDNDGFDANNIATDGKSSLVFQPSNDFKYVVYFEQNFTRDNVNYDVEGVMGVTTKADDIPNSGSAHFAGNASAVVISTAGGFDLTNGNSSIDANFATGKVNVELNNFTISNHTGSNNAAPIDSIKVSDMTISGNKFSGGTLETFKSGTTVNVTGANSVSGKTGNFFGYNTTTSTPAEAAGVLTQYGDDGSVSAKFMAK